MRKLDALFPYAARSALSKREEQLIEVTNEYKNYRRRTQSEMEVISIKTKSDTIEAFLSVYDNLQRALNYGCSDETFIKGVQMTMERLIIALISDFFITSSPSTILI